MRVTLGMIDPQLRPVGVLAKLFFRPSARFFRIIRALGRRTEGRDVEGLRCEERKIDSGEDAAKVRLRIYRPKGAAADARLPGVLYLHGGGYAFGNPEGFASTFEMLMQTRECVIVAPDYRKSLDVPYPAAVNDCYATLLWMRDNAADLGIRDDQIIVTGGSAGGGLTAAVVLMARDRKEVAVAFQMPLYPMMDDRMTTESSTDNNAPMWGSKHNRLGWDLYLGNLAGRDVPAYAAPARETDYSDLPPTATFVGSLDPFRDETLRFAENLRAAGVRVEWKLFEGCYHGFDLVQPEAEVSREANSFMRDQFAFAVDNYFASQPARR